MRMSKNLLAVAVVVACCLAVIWFSTSIQGSQKTYEIKPHITAPEYRTDAARAIDAYERLMERYMGLTEKNLLSFGTDIRNVITKIDSIDDKLTQLGARIAQIEKALGIELAPASTDTSQDRQQSNLSVKGKKQQKSPVEKD